MERSDAIVTLSGAFSTVGGMGDGTRQRVDTAVALIESEVSDRLIVSGSHSFTSRLTPPTPMAALMRDYAVDRGIPRESVFVQDKSLDTIGDALFTREVFTDPNEWYDLTVVTSGFHSLRAQKIFERVMGGRYNLARVASDNREPDRSEKLWDGAGRLLSGLVLSGVEPGDVNTIRRRLYRTVPGYSSSSIVTKASNLALGR